ncbi:Fic family protein [Clostridium aestuarii]|uniref:Fic family protein n=1 Tax=Clostridium aestuarii TaxID=338193 RepID=A0ABT4D2N6_9CLOT|nr:Fic family protein [Clostridium aestuarii]MCY6485507.1 Fic family protein [Clostridium aestuarii]
MQNMINEFNKRYFTKKELQYRLPSTFNLNEFWNELMESRKNTSINIPLKDQSDNNFWFNITDNIKKYISIIETSATEDLFKSIPWDVEASVILDSLIDEAYNSSVIEGAFSTKKRTKEMVENNLPPKDKNEQMIINNFDALQYILRNMQNPLNEDMLLSIYKILTEDTLKEDEIVEKYRTDFVGVWDTKRGCFSYKAPDHTKVQTLMDDLLDFINNNTELHPLIKACIIHFYFVYIHPFFDGNGRTARAISYMYLLQQGYDFFKFFSISNLINEERNKYYTSIENTEVYQSDLTYFIDYYLNMIVKSIQRIKEQFTKEFGKKLLKDLLEKAGIMLNKRQTKIINYFITANKNIMIIDEYKKKNKISYETSRTDLNELVTLGFFKKTKVGKKYVYKFNKLGHIIKDIEESFIEFE